ncbi:MAG: phosphoribosylformylglycinamidine synthase subunit PurQ [Planctomycetes bacterium]|nr:phosphoribosylformylglycinamidine synthase subunit PurQ [Planctomycetota bacterium]
MSPKVLILRAPGTNCDIETAFAFERAGGAPERVHIGRLLEKPSLADDFQILCIPGGFSYGDDVAAGRILACQIQNHLQDCLWAFRDAGKLVLGICNGFQVLIKSGLLLDGSEGNNGTPAATLTWNDSGKFEDRWVQLGVEGIECVFFSGIESMYLPIAHAEGKFVARDEAALDALQDAGQLVLRYCWTGAMGSLPALAEQRALSRKGGQAAHGTLLSPGSDGAVPYPDNPNGAQRNVAGLCDASGRVLGLMPHPERHIDPTHHPRWTRQETLPEVGDGLRVFQNAVQFFR